MGPGSGSAVRHTSVAKHVTDWATRHGSLLLLCSECHVGAGLFPAILGKGTCPNLEKNGGLNITIGRNQQHRT